MSVFQKSMIKNNLIEGSISGYIKMVMSRCFYFIFVFVLLEKAIINPSHFRQHFIEFNLYYFHMYLPTHKKWLLMFIHQTSIYLRMTLYSMYTHIYLIFTQFSCAIFCFSIFSPIFNIHPPYSFQNAIFLITLL